MIIRVTLDIFIYTGAEAQNTPIYIYLNTGGAWPLAIAWAVNRFSAARALYNKTDGKNE